MALNFSDALSSLKKKAQLQGRPISQQEVSGVAEGYSKSASDRLTQIKGLELEQERIDAQKAWQEEQKRQQDIQNKMAYDKRHQEEHEGKGETIGSVIGGVIGAAATWYSGGWGGSIGAGIGGAIGRNCIIISACTSPYSHEVEISREFRDKYMGKYHLGGYYALANKLAPKIRKSHFFKLIIKKFLVDRLVDYGEWILGYKPKRMLKTSRIVTEGFLFVCAAIGIKININPYIEAHR